MWNMVGWTLANIVKGAAIVIALVAVLVLVGHCTIGSF